MKKRETFAKRNLFAAAQIFLLLLVVFLLPSMQAQAATQKSKALKAYKELLSQEKTPWDESASMDGSQFAIIYLDNNNVPELIIKNENVPRIGGAGRLYTYAKGEVVEIDVLHLDSLEKVIDKKPFSYYKKTGIYADGYVNMGYQNKIYDKMSGTKSSYTGLTNAYGLNLEARKFQVEYNINNKKVSKAAFSKKLKKLTKSRKALALKFYENTKANRDRYLK